MGVEIFQFGLAEDNPAIAAETKSDVNGEVLQIIGHLIKEIKSGESGSDFISELSSLTTYSEQDISAVLHAYHQIKRCPHQLEITFDGASRGHDHWAYLLTLGTELAETDLARSTVFGSQPVPDGATASQGIPIRWSCVNQVKVIDAFLAQTDFDLILRKFRGFPTDNTFYKPRKDSEVENCIQELASLRQMYSLASENSLAVVVILD